jgi:hypothetical protein
VKRNLCVNAEHAHSLATVAEVSEQERERLAREGDTAYGTSFPIRDCTDLHNAIQSYGRAPEHERATLRRFIVRRKAELGCPEVHLPEDWHIVSGEE